MHTLYFYALTMSQSTENQTSTDPVSRPFSLETFVVHSYVEDAIQEPPSESAIVADCDNVDLVQRSQQLNDGREELEAASNRNHFARSKSVNFKRTTRRSNGPDCLQWSLPPSKRERRNSTLQASDAQSKDATCNDGTDLEPLAITRSKSVNFKHDARGMNWIRRSLPLTTRGRVNGVHRGQSQNPAEPGFVALFRRPSIRSVLPVIVKLKETKERKWSVAISSLVAAFLGVMRGFTFAFNSYATLDLMGEARELPRNYLLSTSLLSIFAVRHIYRDMNNFVYFSV